MCYEEKSAFDALKWLPYYNLKASVALLCPENSLSFTYPLLKNLLAFLLLKKNKKIPFFENSLFNLYDNTFLYEILSFLFSFFNEHEYVKRIHGGSVGDFLKDAIVPCLVSHPILSTLTSLSKQFPLQPTIETRSPI